MERMLSKTYAPADARVVRISHNEIQLLDLLLVRQRWCSEAGASPEERLAPAIPPLEEVPEPLLADAAWSEPSTTTPAEQRKAWLRHWDAVVSSLVADEPTPLPWPESLPRPSQELVAQWRSGIRRDPVSGVPLEEQPAWEYRLAHEADPSLPSRLLVLPVEGAAPIRLDDDTAIVPSSLYFSGKTPTAF